MLALALLYVECVYMTSRRPCWRIKQRNGGHVGGVKYSFGDSTLFLCKFLLLFHYANMAFGHISEHTLYLICVEGHFVTFYMHSVHLFFMQPLTNHE